MQEPQSMHSSETVAFFSTIVIELFGQPSAQVPHPSHFAKSTLTIASPLSAFDTCPAGGSSKYKISQKEPI